MTPFEETKKAIKDLIKQENRIKSEIAFKERELAKIQKAKILLAFSIGGGEVSEEEFEKWINS